MHLTLSS